MPMFLVGFGGLLVPALVVADDLADLPRFRDSPSTAE